MIICKISASLIALCFTLVIGVTVKADELKTPPSQTHCPSFDPFLIRQQADGLAAYDAGDYATALGIWRPLAEKGDASAQYDIGLIYTYGGQ
jgi:hypothetical protein